MKKTLILALLTVTLLGCGKDNLYDSPDKFYARTVNTEIVNTYWDLFERGFYVHYRIDLNDVGMLVSGHKQIYRVCKNLPIVGRKFKLTAYTLRSHTDKKYYDDSKLNSLFCSDSLIQENN